MAVFTGPRIRANNVYGTISDSPLAAGSTTMNAAGLANLPAVASAHAVIVIDPLRTAGAPEIVIVTAHTGGSTAATVTRGAYGTTARSHANGVLWVHTTTIDDLIRVVTSGTRPSDQYEGQLIYETDTNRLALHGGTDWAYIDAGGTLGYGQVVASQASITTEVDLTGLAATVTVGTGRRIRVSAHIMTGSTGADKVRLRIKEGATVLQTADVRVLANDSNTLSSSVVLTPSAGAHTYKLSLGREIGTGTLTMYANPTFPAYILVEDIGAA